MTKSQYYLHQTIFLCVCIYAIASKAPGIQAMQLVMLAIIASLLCKRKEAQA